jgi:hypothetical protein
MRTALGLGLTSSGLEDEYGARLSRIQQILAFPFIPWDKYSLPQKSVNITYGLGSRCTEQLVQTFCDEQHHRIRIQSSLSHDRRKSSFKASAAKIYPIMFAVDADRFRSFALIIMVDILESRANNESQLEVVTAR